MAEAAGKERRARGLLAVGVALGLAGALAGLVGGGDGEGGALPPGAVATVNGEPIAREAWGQAVAGLSADRRAPVGDEERRFVLDRLIEEELLVQRGLELGLARYDRRVRGDLVAAVVEGIVAEAEAVEPEEAELVAFHEDNREWFTRPGRLHVRRLWVAARGDPAAAELRAERAAARLRAGEPFGVVDAELGDAAVAEVPDAPLPATKLREYLGPTALAAAEALAPGEIGGPVRAGGGFHVLWLVDREAVVSPPFEEIRDPVASEWRRRAGERALRAYLDRLRGRAAVRIAEPLP